MVEINSGWSQRHHKAEINGLFIISVTVFYVSTHTLFKWMSFSLLICTYCNQWYQHFHMVTMQKISVKMAKCRFFSHAIDWIQKLDFLRYTFWEVSQSFWQALEYIYSKTQFPFGVQAVYTIPVQIHAHAHTQIIKTNIRQLFRIEDR